MRLRYLMSIVLLSLGLAVTPLFTTSARADDTPKERPAGGPEGLLTRMRANIDKLNLTSEQKPKVDAAFDDAKIKIKAVVKENEGADREALRGKIGPIIKDLMEKVHAVLTPEQLEELKKSRENARKPAQNSN